MEDYSSNVSQDSSVKFEVLQAEARRALHRGKPAAALSLYARIVRTRPSIESYTNMAIALYQLRRYDEALAISHRAVNFAQNVAVVWANHATLLRGLNRLDESLTAFQRSLDLEPQHVDVVVKKALCLLCLGRYQEGFALREQKWASSKWLRILRQFPQRRWLGASESLRGKRILIHSERGLGDTVQLVRYAKLVAEAGGFAILEVQPALKPLLTGLPHVVSVCSVGEQLPEFDVHCAFSSLPHLFGTTLDSIPQEIPYLHVQPGWRRKSAQLVGGGRLRIGFVYRGNIRHGGGIFDQRPIPLAILLRLCTGTPHGWFCLQTDATVREMALMKETPNVAHLGGQIENLADTAAIIEQLDLIISIDTAVAHLAAAVGKPVWVLAPFSPAWQWRVFGNKPPWYPHAQVFRQRRPGDWEDLVSVLLPKISMLA